MSDSSPLPPVRLRSEAELARDALAAPLFAGAARLARWAGPDTRVGADGELVAGQLPAAAAELGLGADTQGAVLAATAWRVAVGTGLVEIVDEQEGTVRAGPGPGLLTRSPGDVLRLWLGALQTVIEEVSLPEPGGFRGAGDGAGDGTGTGGSGAAGEAEAVAGSGRRRPGRSRAESVAAEEFLDGVLGNLYLLAVGEEGPGDAPVPLPALAASMIIPAGMTEPTDNVLERVSDAMMRLDDHFRVLERVGLVEFSPVDEALMADADADADATAAADVDAGPGTADGGGYPGGDGTAGPDAADGVKSAARDGAAGDAAAAGAGLRGAPGGTAEAGTAEAGTAETDDAETDDAETDDAETDDAETDDADVSRYGMVRLTPLGRFGLRMRLLEAGYEAPVVGDLADKGAEALLHGTADYPQAAAHDEVEQWLARHEMLAGARELLAAARGEDDGAPLRRLRCQQALSLVGMEAEPALREVLDDAELGGLARVWLTERGAADVPPPTEKMVFWLTIDTLAAQLAAEGNSEELQGLVEGLARQHNGFFDTAWRVGHPATARVLEAMGRLHPDKRIAKEARKAAFKARSQQAG
jgi:hypothetical protein